MFKRDWKLIKETILPSPFEQAIGTTAGRKIRTEIALERWFYQKKLVMVFQCQLTKKIKTITTSLFDDC